jgi:hypothetical protein
LKASGELAHKTPSSPKSLKIGHQDDLFKRAPKAVRENANDGIKASHP